MSISESDREYRQVFDVRAINLTKIGKAIDCDIVIAEAENAIRGIKSQIQDGYGDAEWLRDATRAIEDIDHKRKLALAKKSSIEAERAVVPVSPEAAFKSRFVVAAREILPGDLYNVIFESARARSQATP